MRFPKGGGSVSLKWPHLEEFKLAGYYCACDGLLLSQFNLLFPAGLD